MSQGDPNQFKKYKFVTYEIEGEYEPEKRRVKDPKDIIIDSESSAESGSESVIDEPSSEESGELENPLTATPPQYTPLLQQHSLKKERADVKKEPENPSQAFDSFVRSFLGPGNFL